MRTSVYYDDVLNRMLTYQCKGSNYIWGTESFIYRGRWNIARDMRFNFIGYV